MTSARTSTRVGGRVPLARRQLLAERRRLVASSLAVGMAVMLVLLLDGLWTGVRSQVTRYEDAVGADLYVVAPGVRSLFAEGSTVPISTVEAVRRTPGIEWAAPVRGQFAILELHGGKVAATLVGSVPGEPGGPWSMATGRAPASSSEMVIDQVLAERHGLAVGDSIEVLGDRLSIVGLSRGTVSFMTGFVFVTHDAASSMVRQPESTTAVLVGAEDPATAASALRDRGLAVLTTVDLREAGLDLATRVYGTPLRLMVAVAFLAGTLVIALTTYTLVAEHRREYGIVRAMGATTRRLAVLAIAQTAMVTALGVLAGFALFAIGRLVIVTARPQFEVVLSAGSAGRAVGAAIVMGAVASLVPTRRLARLDPAVAYRGA